ncbi:hypothetical protein [Sphingomonas sp. GB1N7]|uniref:hypothetical protein n=1 Tax=Parasphingomonas caseinilytica TaxID=3096158 RepID=UPI002FC8884B
MTDPASTTRKPAPKSTVAKTRAAANKALDRTLDGARDAADRTVKAIDSNPIPVLVGGLAIGALAGALLPRNKREAELLAPVGQRIRATTSGAVSAAKDVGINELGALGLSKSALNDQAGKLVGNILKALATAGTAAVAASKDASAKKAV